MSNRIQKQYGLEFNGILNPGRVFWNPTTPELYEEAARRREGVIAHLGPLVVRTGHYTGRSPNDKFIVRELASESKVWWGKVNVPFDESKFDAILARLKGYMQGRDLFIQDCYAGANHAHRIKIRVITETAWHSLFSRNMFIREHDDLVLASHKPDFTVINMPSFHADTEQDGTNSETFVIVHFGRGIVIIGGTSYAGEIKKSIFTILNYVLPQQGVMTMHASANHGPGGDVAVFFGLSGTGKTTLSADPARILIGDDEHGWGNDGVFNCEGGCYAKVIRLSEEAEPAIYDTTRKFGTVLENVTINFASRRINLDDDSFTENTRAAYPVSHIPNSSRKGIAGHPKNIVMLTADAFGVMPPIAKLTPEQAMYHFISGYTAKLAGTERGMDKSPSATFSACFGAPFMALPPAYYANLLGKKIADHGVNCWLVNTGWTGGPYGTGQRMKIGHTRALLNAALAGDLDRAEFVTEPVFGLKIPKRAAGIPPETLDPRESWHDKNAYDTAAKKLAADFKTNISNFPGIPPEILAAGPK